MCVRSMTDIFSLVTEQSVRARKARLNYETPGSVIVREREGEGKREKTRGP